MTISKPDKVDQNKRKQGGALADALTLTRALITPLIMVIIVLGWPLPEPALLATALFGIAAMTDIFDDLLGGADTAPHRAFGWFDDIADLVLILGTLIAFCWVIWNQGLMQWTLAVPAAILVLREVIVGLMRGYELSKAGWPQTPLGTLKNALTMLAILLLLASPWLTLWLDGLRAGEDANVIEVYSTNSPYLWFAGTGLLWIAALLSLITGLDILRRPKGDHQKDEA